MIDLHCHFLPGIDDGPQTLAEALELADMAVQVGIHTSVMTPHVHPGRWNNTVLSIAEAVRAFQQALIENNIPLKVLPGAEVRLSADIVDMVIESSAPFVGRYDNFRVMLLEFPHSHIPVGSDNLCRWLLARDVMPLIAHPERNKAVMRNPDKIQPFVGMGCMLQITGGSLLGGFGTAARETALTLLEQDSVTLVATDAHNLERRPPTLDRAYRALRHLGGEALATRLTETMPGRIAGVISS